MMDLIHMDLNKRKMMESGPSSFHSFS